MVNLLSLTSMSFNAFLSLRCRAACFFDFCFKSEARLASTSATGVRTSDSRSSSFGLLAIASASARAGLEIRSIWWKTADALLKIDFPMNAKTASEPIISAVQIQNQAQKPIIQSLARRGSRFRLVLRGHSCERSRGLRPAPILWLRHHTWQPGGRCSAGDRL